MLSRESAESSTKPKILQDRVLVVEADNQLREILVLALKEKGFAVVTASDGCAALNFLLKSNQASFPFSLIIFDWILPQIDSFSLCRWLRSQGNSVPVLILSGKRSEADVVLGLEAGADDYLVKPFGVQEFIARCRALCRRPRLGDLSNSRILSFKEINLYSQECRVIARGQEVHLTPKEFRLLELLMKSPCRAWSRGQLLNEVWGPNFIGGTKTVDVHIGWLRKKLELDPEQPEYMLTVRGVGYGFGCTSQFAAPHQI